MKTRPEYLPIIRMKGILGLMTIAHLVTKDIIISSKLVVICPEKEVKLVTGRGS